MIELIINISDILALCQVLTKWPGSPEAMMEPVMMTLLSLVSLCAIKKAAQMEM